MRIGGWHMMMVFVVMLAAITTYIMTGYRKESVELAEGSGKKDTVSDKPDFRIEGVNYVEIKEGKRQWELNASVANYFKQKEIAVFEDVTLSFFSREGRDFVIKGKRGFYDSSKGNIELKGAVRVKTSDGYFMDTDAIEYNEKEKKVLSAGKVSFSGKDIKGEGGKMILDLEREKLFLENGVKVVIHPQGEKK